jgi:hypothetical protein
MTPAERWRRLSRHARCGHTCESWLIGAETPRPLDVLKPGQAYTSHSHYAASIMAELSEQAPCCACADLSEQCPLCRGRQMESSPN